MNFSAQNCTILEKKKILFVFPIIRLSLVVVVVVVVVVGLAVVVPAISHPAHICQLFLGSASFQLLHRFHTVVEDQELIIYV
jgi:hypothetical protein